MWSKTKDQRQLRTVQQLFAITCMEPDNEFPNIVALIENPNIETYFNDTFQRHYKSIEKIHELYFERPDPSCVERLRHLRDLKSVGGIFKVRGRIFSMLSTRHIAIPSGLIDSDDKRLKGAVDLLKKRDNREYEATILTIEDDHNDQYQTLPLVDPELVNNLWRNRESRNTWDFTVSVVSHQGQFYLLVLEANLSEQLATRVSVEGNKDIIFKRVSTEMRNHKCGVLDYLISKFVSHFGVVGLDRSPVLKKALEHAALILFSNDELDDGNGSLQMLMLGPPGVGKKLIGLFLRSFAPVLSESQPGKATKAGLAGTAMVKRGIYTSRPGAIPKAHRGVFYCQDIHEADLDSITSIFSMVMEDGKVIDSTSANTTHPAVTSLVMDLNPRSTVDPKWKSSSPLIGRQKLKSIGLPINFLSRVDLIHEFTSSLSEEIKTSSEMILKSGAPQKATDRLQEIKYTIARIKDKIPTVTISKEIREYASAKYSEMANKRLMGDNHLLNNQAQNFMRRLSKSLLKIAMCYARANAQSSVNRSHVDFAIEHLKDKFDFILSIEGIPGVAFYSQNTPEHRRLEIRRVFGNHWITQIDAHNLIKGKFGSCSYDTLLIDLRTIQQSKTKEKETVFLIPPLDLGEFGTAEIFTKAAQRAAPKAWRARQANVN